ncbi:MAG TPA: hypothetical protein VF188_00010 [Longimicrobiales bacterium]
MRRKLGLAGAMAAVIFAAAACSDDEPTGVEGDQFTQEEAEDLAELIMSTSYLAFAESAPTGAPQSLAGGLTPQAAQTLHIEVNQTRDCLRGGSFTIEGAGDFTFDDENESGELDVNVTETHEDCSFPFRNGTVVLNGDPNLNVAAHFAYANGVPEGEQTLSYGGGIAWEFGDRSGSCSIDLDASVSADFEGDEVTSVTQHIEGTFCGRSITRDVSITVE